MTCGRYGRSRAAASCLPGLIAIAFLAAGGTAAAQGAERGVKVYADQKCTACHAIAGKGNAKGPLDDVGSRLKVDEIREWIVNAPEMAKKSNSTRKPLMRAYANLPKEDLDALVVYLVALKKK